MNAAMRKRFGQYEVLSGNDGRDAVHASGPHDITYLATDTRLDRRVHLRVLRPEFLGNAPVREAFLAAIRSLARIRHSNIAGVLDIGEGRESCHCAIEDPSGDSLQRLINRLGCMDVSSALLILDQSAKVLREIWQSSHVISLLSPSSIEVCYEGDELIVKFPDLHIVPVSERGARLASNKPADASPDFRSPEEIAGGEVDIRSNIYSLGLVFSELLAGEGGSRSFLSLGSKTTGPEIHAFRKLPEKILYLLERMLERDPDRRIQTPYELRSLIEQCEREGVGGGSSMIRPETLSGPAGADGVDAQAGTDADVLPLEFNLMNTLDERGLFREADDRVRGGRVIVHLFGSDKSPLEVATCVSLAEKLLAHPHPNIVRIIRVHPRGRRRFITYEKVSGVTLLEVMRKRHKLSLPEVLTLLDQAASAADHAVEHDVAGLAFAFPLMRIVLEDHDPGEQNSGWMRLPAQQWPSFTLKIPVYGSSPGLDSEVPSLAAVNDKGLLLSIYLREIAETAHELLGGAKPRNIAFTEASYTPLSTLSEQGNMLLRRGLFGEEGAAFSSAAEFVAALKGTARDKGLPASFAPKLQRKREGDDSGDSSKPLREAIPGNVSRARSLPSIAISALILLVVIAVAFLLLKTGRWPLGQNLESGALQKNDQGKAPPDIRLIQSPEDDAPRRMPTPDPTEVPAAASSPEPAETPLPATDSREERPPDDMGSGLEPGGR
jgi:serine/threonine protein kinase